MPYQFALGYTEAPRGEDIHWSMTGDNQKLYRWRCRASSYNNWPSLRYMLRGNTISDAPMIVASIDPCYSCTDRVTIVDVRKRNTNHSLQRNGTVLPRADQFAAEIGLHHVQAP